MPALPERDIPTEHHVWVPAEQAGPEVPFDRYGHALLREIRGREPPRERVRLGIALFLAIVFHVVLVVVLRFVMRPQYIPPAPAVYGEPLDVVLYESPAQPSAVPPPPEINLPPLRTRELSPRRVRIQPRNPQSMTATIGETQPSPRLFGRNGQALLPPPSSVAGVPDYTAPQPHEPGLMQHSTPLPYQSTRFNKDWVPDKESLGAKAFRKAVDATTMEKTVRLPGGMKVKCVASPLVLGFGCGPLPPPPPPKNDNDPRLSLPPSVSLTGKKVSVPAAPSTAALPAKATTQGHP